MPELLFMGIAFVIVLAVNAWAWYSLFKERP